MVIHKYPLFGGECSFSLDAESEEPFSEAILEEAYALALRLQKIFNLYDDKSETSILNRNRKIKASPEFLEVLETALRLCALSQGEYDITLGKQFLQRKKGLPAKKASCSYKDVEIEGNWIRLLNDDAWLDLGSIAKGYIAERVSKYLRNAGLESGYVDARGDLRLFGQEMTVGVQHPRSNKTSELLLKIRLRDKGVATSGDYSQYVGNHDNSHILNKKDVISATVVSDDLMTADAYATLLMVCPQEKREELMRLSRLPALTVDESLNLVYYNGFEELIAPEN